MITDTQAAQHFSVNDFLAVPYLDGGRDMDGLDCWGQVRLARALLFGRDMATSYGHILCANKPGMTDAFAQMLPRFAEVSPRPGAVACCFKPDAEQRPVLLHVGLVVEAEGIKVLHTNAKAGPHLLPLRAFGRLSLDVRFFDDCHRDHLSQQAGQNPV
ncbi:hypothetical protein [Ferrimonas pelagia]|uniref:NlpC/P60 family protein n=1 Tax=Ferrimonas pelagia TaxID=1177826 RepID=A0ABP9EI18_9GAMM